MSTKIYNGYRVWAESLDEAIQILKAPEEKMKNQLFKLSLKTVLEKAIIYHDVNVLNHTCLHKKISAEKNFFLEDLNKSAFDAAWDDNRWKKEKNPWEEEEKTYNEVINYIYPHKLIENGKSYYLFTYHGEEQIKNGYFKLIKEVDKYGYWDNTDRPSGVTNKQWEKRESDWQVLLDGSGIPVEKGVGLTVARQHTKILYIADKKEMIKKFIAKELVKEFSLEKRIKKYLIGAITQDLINEAYKKLPKEEQENGDQMSIGLDLYGEANSMIRNDELPEEMKEKKATKEKEMRLVLNEITYDALHEPLEEMIKKKQALLFAGESEVLASEIKVKTKKKM